MQTFRPSPNDNYISLDHELTISKLMLEQPYRWNDILLVAPFNSTAVQEILKIHLPQFVHSHMVDKPIWTNHNSAKFSVKLAFDFIMSQQNNQTLQNSPLTKNKLEKVLKYISRFKIV